MHRLLRFAGGRLRRPPVATPIRIACATLLAPLLAVAPPVGGTISVGSLVSSSDTPVEVAFDETHQCYLVVWGRYAGSSTQILGQRISQDGSRIGAEISIDSAPVGYASFWVGVANNNAQDTFVVTWTENLSMVKAVGVAAATGAKTNVVTVASSSSLQIRGVNVGGNSVASGSATRDDVVVIWGDNDVIRAGRIRIDGTTIAPVGSVVDVTDIPGIYRDLKISSSGGQDGRYVVAWGKLDGYSFALHGAVLGRNAAVLVPPQVVHPDIAGGFGIDGDGDRWVIAYSVTSGGNQDVLCRTIEWAGNNRVTVGAEVTALADPAVNEVVTDVAWIGGSCLLVSVRLRPRSFRGVYVTSIDAFSCAVCEGTTELVAPTETIRSWPGIASAASGGAMDRRALVAWDRDPAGLEAHRYQADEGVVIGLGGACGGGGDARASCARTGNATFAHLLQNAAPQATAHLISSLQRIDIACGGCTLVPDPFTGFYLGRVTTDANGSGRISMPIPNAPELQGLRLYDQWLVVRASPSCGALGIDLSSAISINIQ